MRYTSQANVHHQVCTCAFGIAAQLQRLLAYAYLQPCQQLMYEPAGGQLHLLVHTLLRHALCFQVSWQPKVHVQNPASASLLAVL
jgi:hypothetical protein